MSAAAELIASLERATAELAHDLDNDPGFALLEREAALCALQAMDARELSEEESARLHAIALQGLELIERVRERRRHLLDQIQEAAAARCLATALAPTAGRAIVDVRL